jgi:hypothetical protein
MARSQNTYQLAHGLRCGERQGQLTRVKRITQSKGDEHNQFRAIPIDPIHTQGHIMQNCKGIFPAVSEMGKYIPSIIVTAETLKHTPDSRKCGEKTLEARMRGATRVRIVPVHGV